MASYKDEMKLDELYSNRLKNKIKITNNKVDEILISKENKTIVNNSNLKENNNSKFERDGEIFVKSMLQRMNEKKYI